MSRCLLQISIGPVQDFISAARRTRDLWFGSYLLSEISKAAAKAVKNGGGRLIFPNLDGMSPKEIDSEECNVANVILATPDFWSAAAMKRWLFAGSPKDFSLRESECAFKCVRPRDKDKEYRSFALAFPSLIHSCGLVQAVAFAEVKNKGYAEDLTAVLKVVEADINLAQNSRNADVIKYMRLSRRALAAASWLKRYVQAFDDKKEVS
jgi:CRISPR/Cas system CMR-associated protein Cmr5 small subunit